MGDVFSSAFSIHSKSGRHCMYCTEDLKCKYFIRSLETKGYRESKKDEDITPVNRSRGIGTEDGTCKTIVVLSD